MIYGPHLTGSMRTVMPDGESYDLPVMEDTGMYDRYGVLIWNGDIVRHESDEVGLLEVTMFRGKWIGVAYDTSYQDIYDEEFTIFIKTKDILKCKKLTVVGNIHENPDLLPPSGK